MRQMHDDVIKWKHFPRYWPFVRGIHRSPVNSPHKGRWRKALCKSKQESKQWWGWWFETPSRSSWRHCNGCVWCICGVIRLKISQVGSNGHWKKKTVTMTTKRLTGYILMAYRGDIPVYNKWIHAIKIIKSDNFYPWPFLSNGNCRCLRLCVHVCVTANHRIVCAIAHHPFKLRSLNWDQRWKTTWLRSLLVWGWLTLTFWVKFIVKIQISLYPVCSPG